MSTLEFLRTIEIRPSRELLEDKMNFREEVEKKMAAATADKLKTMSAKEELSPLEAKAHELLCSVLPILDTNGVKMYITPKYGTEPQEYRSNLDLADYPIKIVVAAMPKRARQLEEIESALVNTLRKDGLLEVRLGFVLPALENEDSKKSKPGKKPGEKPREA